MPGVSMNTPSDDKLVSLLADLFRINDDLVSDDMAMGKTAIWDSLKHMELVCVIESAYGIGLSLEDIVAMRSVAGIRAVLGRKEPTGASGA